MPSMQLNEVKLKSLKFDINPNYNSDSPPEGLGFDISIGGETLNPKKDFIVELCVQIPGKSDKINIPFSIDIIYLGFFQFDEKVDDELFDYFKKVNCPAIIFPYLRETVADITRRAGFPPLHLPTINFVQMRGKEPPKKLLQKKTKNTNPKKKTIKK